MKYSVVIPAFNEAERIGRTINILKQQTVPRKDFEVIIAVDNLTTDLTLEKAMEAGADVVLRAAKRGTNLARQAGYEKSKGEIIAFLDADSVPPPNWLKRISDDLSRFGVAAVSGPYDYGFRGWKRIIDGIYTWRIVPHVPRILEFVFRRKAGIIIGGNFATKRGAIEKIGGLPPVVFWGDDVAIAMLISRRVGKVIFDLKLIVKSSNRRFEKQGFFRLGFLYALTYLKIFFDKKYF